MKPTPEPIATEQIRDFNSISRVWESAEESHDSLSSVLSLDGTLSTDSASLTAIADDFGHLVSRTPIAILRPGSVDDVIKMVCFAKEHGLRITGRGNGHTAFGQSQVDAGIVIDLSSLNQIRQIDQNYAVVDAGVVWRDLLLAATAQRLTPPVLTDYTQLTVGGTLSVGGVSGRSYQYGAQVDNVLELQVVTGEGQLVTCSEYENSELFNAALAGLGICVIIVRATIRLIPTKERAQTLRLFYPDAPSMLNDLRLLANNGRFDHIRGNSTPVPPADPAGQSEGFAFFIEATSFYTSPDELPLNPLEGLHFISGSAQVEDRTYFEFTDLVVQLLAQLNAAGLGHLPHPWLDLFVADSAIDAFASQTIEQLDPATFLPGSLMLFFPFIKSRLKRPLFRTPNEDTFFLFDILRTIPPDSAVVNAVMAENRRLYEQNRSLGGSFYTISAIPMETRDWQQHFGSYWNQLTNTKGKHDPSNVLGASLTVFK